MIYRMVGVTHPGQKRYVQYFEQILRSGPTNFEFEPRCRRLISIIFYGIPNYNNGSCRPQVDIFNVRDNRKVSLPNQIHSEKFDDLRKIMANSEKQGEVCELNYRDKNVLIYGDTFIKIKHLGSLE